MWKCSLFGNSQQIQYAGKYRTGAGGLLLAGHTDTVPFDDGRWTRDPFTLTEHDGKLYGLGTADMKGFLRLSLMRYAMSTSRN